MKNTLSFYLKFIRNRHGKERLSAMAKKLGVSASYLSSVENGKKPMSDKLFHSIVSVYKLDEAETKELNVLRHLEIKNLNVKTDDMDDQKKEVVIKFLSNLDSLDEDDLEKIEFLINKSK